MTTDITELALSLKAEAVRAKKATEEYASGHMSVSVCFAECEEFNRLTDGPDNILALVEVLEKAQQRNAELENYAEAEATGADKAAEDSVYWMRRCKELESRTIAVKLPDFRTTYKGSFADEVEHQVRNALDAFSIAAGIKWEAE